MVIGILTLFFSCRQAEGDMVMTAGEAEVSLDETGRVARPVIASYGSVIEQKLIEYGELWQARETHEDFKVEIDKQLSSLALEELAVPAGITGLKVGNVRLLDEVQADNTDQQIRVSFSWLADGFHKQDTVLALVRTVSRQIEGNEVPVVSVRFKNFLK